MKRRHKRIGFIIAGLAGLGVAAALVLSAFQENLVFFFSPSQVVAKEAPIHKTFRVGGLVEAGTLKRDNDGLTVHFTVTDTAKSIPVIYKGILPDLFKEGKGCVAQGRNGADGVCYADLVLALTQATLPLIGAARGNQSWIAVAAPAGQAQFIFVAIAFCCLGYSFITNDFSVVNVATNSNSQLPLHYRLAATWGSHEGSLLLWTFMLGLWTVAVSLFSRHLPDDMVARVLGVMGVISVGFLLFMLLTSNPFARLFPAAADGRDLNPLLQDPAMVAHPPMLYMGYVGFSVAFAFAISALISGRLDATWARWSRPWTTVAWMFLTVGIALVSWWAYYELGWGGWWFWDPVENASFMPWLVGTALIHSLAVTEKRGGFKSWTVLLAIAAFSLSLLGTSLERSGLSLHVHVLVCDH